MNSSNPTFVEESDSEMRLDVSGKQKSAIPFFVLGVSEDGCVQSLVVVDRTLLYSAKT